MLPSCEPDVKDGLYGGFSFPSVERVDILQSEMLEHVRHIQKYATFRPRTYSWEFPFFTIISSFKQRYCLGQRPEDLKDVDTIEQKALKKHEAYLNRLERFPLDKAEYYLRLKEAHGAHSVRDLAKITGEDWSYIAKILKILSLPESIKEFLMENKEKSAIVKIFHLKTLLGLVRLGDERYQIGRFQEILKKIDENCNLEGLTSEGFEDGHGQESINFDMVDFKQKELVNVQL